MNTTILLIIGAISFVVALTSILISAIEDGCIAACIATISTITAVGSIALLCIGTNKLYEQPWILQKQPYSTEKIVALNDNNLVNGSLYLRSGYIKEDLYYQYMVKLSNRGYTANKVPSSDTTIFYDDENPRVEWYKKERSWWFFSEEDTYNKIYIPEGSITEGYSVDLE